jgi:hypothetical protein
MTRHLKKLEGGILFFLPKNMSADILALGFSLKVEPYSAPADVQLLTSFIYIYIYIRVTL